MFNFFVTEESGLTKAGYAAAILFAVIALALAFYLAGKASKSKKMTPKQIVFCAVALALAYVTSYLKVSFPFGGSITMFSMLFIVLIGYWYGAKVGILTGFAYGILQFIQEPYVLSLFQVCCDYIFAFSALGFAGFFTKSKNGLLKGYIVAILARGFFHTLGGYLFWMSYMPESFPKSLTAVYPIVYNYAYILTEGVLTVIVISIPAVKKALEQIKQTAIS